MAKVFSLLVIIAIAVATVPLARSFGTPDRWYSTCRPRPPPSEGDITGHDSELRVTRIKRLGG